MARRTLYVKQFRSERKKLAMNEPVRKISIFERYLTLWVLACMGVGIVLGKSFPNLINNLRTLEFGAGSQINVPIAVLIWLMIYPMMLKIDLSSVLGVRKKPEGVIITLIVNFFSRK